MTAHAILAREVDEAAYWWTEFAETRSEDDWREYCAAYRRVQIVNVNLGINFRFGRPVLRVKASVI